MNKLTNLSIIHEAVCDMYGLEKERLFERTRKHEILIPRQWFHYLCRKLAPLTSCVKIGNYYSDVTGNPFKHCSILHSTKTISGYVENYREYKSIETDLIYDIKKRQNIEYYTAFSQKICNPMIYESLNQ